MYPRLGAAPNHGANADLRLYNAFCMAALIEPARSTHAPQLRDLRSMESSSLDALLEEEVGAWRRDIHWDFHPSADLVRRFVGMQALQGFALIQGSRTIGYCYYITEENKGLIGDLYVAGDSRSEENENLLLEAVLAAMIDSRSVRRVECQLMMTPSSPERRFPFPQFLSLFDRKFMMRDLKATPPLAPGRGRHRVWFENWTDRHQEPASRLIAASYSSHIDSRINDQYRSGAGARRFLYNIVQYPGCGAFFRPASYAAFDNETGQMAGVVLTSLVASDAGHITQLCVSNSVRGAGVGFELLRKSLESFAGHGCGAAGLTVTSANHGAVRLYENTGFAVIRKFTACVWEGFRG